MRGAAAHNAGPAAPARIGVWRLASRGGAAAGREAPANGWGGGQSPPPQPFGLAGRGPKAPGRQTPPPPARPGARPCPPDWLRGWSGQPGESPPWECAANAKKALRSKAWLSDRGGHGTFEKVTKATFSTAGKGPSAIPKAPWFVGIVSGSDPYATRWQWPLLGCGRTGLPYSRAPRRIR